MQPDRWFHSGCSTHTPEPGLQPHGVQYTIKAPPQPTPGPLSLPPHTDAGKGGRRGINVIGSWTMNLLHSQSPKRKCLEIKSYFGKKDTTSIHRLKSVSIPLPPSLPRICFPKYLIGRCSGFVLFLIQIHTHLLHKSNLIFHKSTVLLYRHSCPWIVLTLGLLEADLPSFLLFFSLTHKSTVKS